MISESIKAYAIKKPDGSFWKTPKGKSTWNSIGAAKNSWNHHNYISKEVTYEYGGKTHTCTRWVSLNWKVDAEPNGWSVVKLTEIKFVEDTENA